MTATKVSKTCSIDGSEKTSGGASIEAIIGTKEIIIIHYKYFFLIKYIINNYYTLCGSGEGDNFSGSSLVTKNKFH